MNFFKKLLTWYLEHRKTIQLKKEVRKRVPACYFTMDKIAHPIKQVTWLSSIALLTDEQTKSLVEEWGELYEYLPLSFKSEKANIISSRDSKRKNDTYLALQREKAKKASADQPNSAFVTNGIFTQQDQPKPKTIDGTSDMITRHHQEDHDQRMRNSVISTSSTDNSSPCSSETNTSSDTSCSGGGTD